MYAHEMQGQRYDAGDKLGFLIATVEFALKNPTLGPPFARYLRDLYRNDGSVAAPDQMPIHRITVCVERPTSGPNYNE